MYKTLYNYSLASTDKYSAVVLCISELNDIVQLTYKLKNKYQFISRHYKK